MIVKRIVANVAATESDMAKVRAFYEDLLGLEVFMNHGWIMTLAPITATAAQQTPSLPQISVTTQGGLSGTTIPDLSIEVDNLDEALKRVEATSVSIKYGPLTEPWDVRRFYVRDPMGRFLNICNMSE